MNRYMKTYEYEQIYENIYEYEQIYENRNRYEQIYEDMKTYEYKHIYVNRYEQIYETRYEQKQIINRYIERNILSLKGNRFVLNGYLRIEKDLFRSR